VTDFIAVAVSFMLAANGRKEKQWTI